MADAQLTQLDRLWRSMEMLESQRDDLGDEAVEPALYALREQIAILEEAQRVEFAADEDRRIVTILFTDIVESSAIAADLDPEEWRAVVTALHAMAGKSVQAYGGMVVQYLGDGLLALFGAQRSSERDPESAVCAALEIQKEVPSLEIEVPIQLRVGIHTGLVILGLLGSEAKREFTASGEAMNIADRVQEAATPGTVLISRNTYRHIRGLFDVTPESPLTQKGNARPVQTFQVTQYKRRPYRIIHRGVGGVETSTVGREAEKRKIWSAYTKAQTKGELIWAQLVGQPGVGKTRLFVDTSEMLEARPEEALLLRTNALEGDGNEPYALIRRMWFDHFQIPDDAPLDQAERSWVTGIRGVLGSDSEEAAHALGLHLGLPFKDSPYIGVMREDPHQLMGRAYAVSRELLGQLRRDILLAILIEDLHWADPSSWDYLTQVILGSEGAKRGTYILATARSEWIPPDALLDQPGYVQVDLGPLSESGSYLLASELLQRVERIPEHVLNLVAERSEGVPYFAEEIVNWFIDEGILDRGRDPWRFVVDRFEGSPLPSTLHHLLQTRLLSLSEDQRQTLQHGSVFGRRFWEGAFQALGITPPPESLDYLRERGFVEAQPTSPFPGEPEWRFQHNLMREVVYDSILKRHRPDLHRAAGGWLENQARKTNRLDEWAGRVGEHAERAGDESAAADWYLRAGKRAKTQGALVEAKGFFNRALALISSDDRSRRWDALLERDGVLDALGATEQRKDGLPSLRDLAEELEEPAWLAEVFYREAVFFENTGNYSQALNSSQAGLELARQAGNQRLEFRILTIMLICFTRVGELENASSLADELLGRSGAIEDETTLARVLTNVSVHDSDTGNYERSVDLGLRQIEITHRLGDRIGEAIGWGNLGYNYVQLGQYEKGREALDRSLKLNEALGARRIRAYNLLNLGLCEWRRVDLEAAERVLTQALAEFEAMSDTFGKTTSVSYLALILENHGEHKVAIQHFTQARDLFAEGEVPGFEHDALAGLVRCSLASDLLEDARKHAALLWDFLSQYGPKGMEFPIWAFLTCAMVFRALDDHQRSRAALEAGYQALMTQADKINDAELRQSYLTNVPEHRKLVEEWNRTTLE